MQIKTGNLPKSIKVRCSGYDRVKWPNISGTKLIKAKRTFIANLNYPVMYTFNNLANKNLMFRLELIGNALYLQGFKIVKS
jgi:hypothetical protein